MSSPRIQQVLQALLSPKHYKAMALKLRTLKVRQQFFKGPRITGLVEIFLSLVTIYLFTFYPTFSEFFWR